MAQAEKDMYLDTFTKFSRAHTSVLNYLSGPPALPEDMTITQFGVLDSDVLERLTEEISLEPSPTIEGMAERLARQIAATQRTERAEVFIRAKYPLKKLTPLSGRSVEEIYTFIGIASCSGEKIKTVTGVEVEGMTVCPCAQDMVRSHSKKLLVEDGFSDGEAERILGLIPLASHNQRGKGTLLIGGDWPVRAEHLVHVLEASMSSETYELLKRSDEFFIVNKANLTIESETGDAVILD